ncbi:hypothetical protein LEMLEM_LOCUS168, partial [Lemmus lemmus]
FHHTSGLKDPGREGELSEGASVLVPEVEPSLWTLKIVLLRENLVWRRLFPKPDGP